MSTLPILLISCVVALVVGCGIIMVCRRRRNPVSRSAHAARLLSSYAERLRASADQIGSPHSAIFWEMAGHLERIRVEVLDDPGDLNQARRFIGHHARLIVELVERFTALEAKAHSEQAARLSRMAAQIHSYRDVFARLETALIENDFAEIEATMSALDTQLERLAF